MNKNINKFFYIYDELKKYNNECSKKELIQATKDLIKFSKQDYISKLDIREYSNDNGKPLDQVFNNKNNRNILNFYFYKDDEKDQLEKDSYIKFNQINRLN